MGSGDWIGRAGEAEPVELWPALSIARHNVEPGRSSQRVSFRRGPRLRRESAYALLLRPSIRSRPMATADYVSRSTTPRSWRPIKFMTVS